MQCICANIGGGVPSEKPQKQRLRLELLLKNSIESLPGRAARLFVYASCCAGPVLAVLALVAISVARICDGAWFVVAFLADMQAA